MGKMDLVTAEILRNKFASVVQDMAATLVNTTYSASIGEVGDFANALASEAGFLVAIDNPAYLASLSYAVSGTLDYFQFDIAGEDVILTNDPYLGGAHIQDFTIVAPLLYKGAIVMYLASRAHMVDIGGSNFGGYNPFAAEIWAEGARFTPIKIYRDGKLQRDVQSTLLLNSRVPDVFKGDIEGMIAAINVGKRSMCELLDEFGIDTVAEAMQYCMDYAERRVKAEVARWPEGEYEGQCQVDHDCKGREGITIRVQLRVKDGSLELDFSNSDAQSDGFVNSTASNTFSHALMPIFALLDESVPKNAGLMRPLKLVTRKGTVVDAAFPAATGWSPFHVGAEIAEAVSYALSRFLPGRVPAVSAKSPLISTSPPGSNRLVDHTFVCRGGAGAAQDTDGWGMPGAPWRASLPSVEMYEPQLQGHIVKMEFCADSGGPGRYRGGLGMETVLRFDSGVGVNVCLEGQVFPAGGIAGGRPGAPTSAFLNKGGESKEIRGFQVGAIASEGSELCLRVGGGGGWGNPLERDPELVLQDVLNEYVSVETAQRDYGVVIDPQKMAVDSEASVSLRAQVASEA